MSKYIRTKYGVYEIADCQYDFLMKKDYGNVVALGLDDNKEVMIKDIAGEPTDDLFKIVDVWFWKESFIEFFVDNIRFTFEGDDFIFFLDETIINDGVYGAIWLKDENGIPYLKTVCKMVDLLKVELI